MTYSVPVDLKFLSQVSIRLERFKRKKDRLYNCRCPLCGDSQSDKTKTRGYFYEYKGGIQYKCHNCGASLSMNNFLKKFAPDVYKEYVFERFGYDNDRRHKKGDFREPDTDSFKKQKVVFKNDDLLNGSILLTSLPDTHEAKVYIESRGIPKEFKDTLRYTDTFKEFTNKSVPGTFDNTSYDEPRIIIPFYNDKKECFAYQGRSLSPKSKTKYISIKRDPEDSLIWGMNRIDTSKTVYVVEGPFDAMFLPNCVAAAGASLSKFAESKFDAVYIFDNEPRNVEILKLMKKIILKGEKICLWPDSIKYKDINDMIKSGLTSEKIMSIISTNTTQGDDAMVKLHFWAKVPI